MLNHTTAPEEDHTWVLQTLLLLLLYFAPWIRLRPDHPAIEATLEATLD